MLQLKLGWLPANCDYFDHPTKEPSVVYHKAGKIKVDIMKRGKEIKFHPFSSFSLSVIRQFHFPIQTNDKHISKARSDDFLNQMPENFGKSHVTPAKTESALGMLIISR